MSSVGIENIAPANNSPHGVEPVKKGGSSSSGSTSSLGKKSSGSSVGGQSGRKMLQTLQPSAKNQTLLVGSDGVLRLASTDKQDIKIYQDPAGPMTSTPERKEPKSKLVQATVKTQSTETQVEDKDTAQARAELLMYGAEDDLPVEYWRDLAEKRREALEVSLTENESLHNSISLLEEENEKIKEEAESYKTMAEKASELADILKGVISDGEEDEDDDSKVNDEQESDSDSQEDSADK